MRKSRIENLIQENLTPIYLRVVNESDRHQGPPGRESHFKLVIVSDDFNRKSRLERHQFLYKLLAEELDGGLHALSLKLYTASEWKELSSQSSLESPECSHKKD